MKVYTHTHTKNVWKYFTWTVKLGGERLCHAYWVDLSSEKKGRRLILKWLRWWEQRDRSKCSCIDKCFYDLNSPVSPKDETYILNTLSTSLLKEDEKWMRLKLWMYLKIKTECYYLCFCNECIYAVPLTERWNHFYNCWIWLGKKYFRNKIYKFEIYNIPNSPSLGLRNPCMLLSILEPGRHLWTSSCRLLSRLRKAHLFLGLASPKHVRKPSKDEQKHLLNP